MLVLSRKINQKIIIGEGENKVEVVVIDIRGDKVRIGLHCDKSIPIHREEVYNLLQKEKTNG